MGRQSEENLIEPRERYSYICKSNELILSRNNLSLVEQKLVLYLISQIRMEDTELHWYEFHITDFCRICGYNLGGRNYQRIRSVLIGLRDKSWWQRVEGPGGEVKEVTMSWINKAVLEPRKGVIRVRLDDDLVPYLLDLHENFTKYQLIHCLGFKSKYTLALYENLCMIHYHPGFGSYTWKYTRRQLLDLFGISEDRYPEWRDFKRRILDVAVEEINEKSNKLVSYETILSVRKVTAVVITVKEKDFLERISAETRVNRELNESTRMEKSASSRAKAEQDMILNNRATPPWEESK